MLEQFEKYKMSCCVECSTKVSIEVCEICKEIKQRKIGWRECLKWLLEKASGDINLIDFTQEIANEAGVNVVTADRLETPGDQADLQNAALMGGISGDVAPLPEGGYIRDIGNVKPVKPVDLRDGMRDVCIKKCGWLQRKACLGVDGNTSIGLVRKSVVKRMGGCPDIVRASKSIEDNEVSNEAKDCKHCDTCRRGCKLIGDGRRPVWVMPADAHNSAGWVPCEDYERGSRNKTHHCKHAELDRKGDFLENGYKLVCNGGHDCRGYDKCTAYEKGGEEIL